MRHILLAAVLLNTVLFSCQEESESTADLYKAVPQSSVIVIETRDIWEASAKIRQTTIYKDADSLNFILQLKQNLTSLSELFPDDSLKSFLANKRTVTSLALSGAGKYNTLTILKGDAGFEKLIGRKLSKAYQFEKRPYSDAEIIRFYQEATKKELFISSYSGLLFISPSKNLLEEGIRQVNSELSIKQNMAFAKLYQTSNKKDLANIFIRNEEFPLWLKTVFPLAESRFIKRTGEWSGFDLQVNDKELILNGIISIGSEGAYFTQAFQNIRPVATEGQKLVPASSGLWVAYTFENAEQYYRNYLSFLEKEDSKRRYQQQISNFLFKPEPTLLNWLDTEMGIFYMGQNTLAYFKFRSEKNCKEALEAITDSSFVEGYRGLIINQLVYENVLPRFYGSLFKGFHRPYFTITNDFAVFANDLATLKGLINDLLDQRALANDEAYTQYSAKIPSKAHITVMGSNPEFLELTASLLEGSDARILMTEKERLNNFHRLSLQLNIDNDAALTNFYLEHRPPVQEKVARQWATVLPHPAIGTPQFVKNHNTKKYEVLLQDEANQLHLLSAGGEILWSKDLDGKIIGECTQIDIFKNNKLQLVFNTENSLYVLDRLGRNVEGFPVKLPAAATAPVGVFNYDNARNYRLVVPCGPMLYNYDVKGKKVQGWNFKKASSDIVSEPQHFAVSGKDIIVCLSADGKLYQLNRRGEERFKVNEKIEELKTSFFLKRGSSLKSSELLANSNSGKLYVINPEGAVDAIYLDEDNPADHFMFFDNKYIFSSGQKLLVKDEENPWVAELDAEVSAKPKAMILKGEFYAGAYSKMAEEIRLFNGKGELIEGFPVFAQGPFDMGSLKLDGTINIVTYSDDGTVICYRVN